MFEPLRGCLVTTNGGRQPSNTGDFQAWKPSHFNVKKKTSQSNSTCFSKRLKAAFLVQQRINRIFRQPKTFQRKEDENSNANPVRLLFKRWRFHPTKSIHFLPTAVQLQCYWSTSISMHKSCTSSYVLGDSPIQKYIYLMQHVRYQQAISGLHDVLLHQTETALAIDECLEYSILHRKQKVWKKTQIFHCKPQKLGGAFVIYPLVN